MLNNLKIVLKDSIIYGIGSLSTRLIGLILLPLYLDRLSAAEYGVLGILEVSSQILTGMFGIRLHRALIRWYWDKDYLDKQKSIFFTILIFLGSFSFLIVFFLWQSATQISTLLFSGPHHSYLIKLMLLSVSLQIISLLPATLMRVQGKSLYYSLSHILKLVISLGLTIYFIVGLNLKIDGIYKAQIFGFIVYFLILTRYMWRNSKPIFEFKILKEMLIFSYPLMLSSLSGLMLSTVDRFALNFLSGLSEVGIYNLGFKMGNTIKVFFITSVQLALTPLLFKMMDQKGNKRFYSKVMTYFTFSVMIFVLILSIFGREVILLLSSKPEYNTAHNIIPFISFAILFGMLKDAATIGLTIKKKTKILATIVFFVSILNFALNVILISWLDFIGAGLANLVSQIIFFIFVFQYAQRYYPIPYELAKILKMILVGLGLFLISLTFTELEIILTVILKLGLVVAFPIILYFFKLYDEVELEKIKMIWSNWKNPLNWHKKILALINKD